MPPRRRHAGRGRRRARTRASRCRADPASGIVGYGILGVAVRLGRPAGTAPLPGGLEWLRLHGRCGTAAPTAPGRSTPTLLAIRAAPAISRRPSIALPWRRSASSGSIPGRCRSGVNGGREIAWTGLGGHARGGPGCSPRWPRPRRPRCGPARAGWLWSLPVMRGLLGTGPAPARRPPPERSALPLEPAARLGDRRQPGVDPRRRPGPDDAPAASCRARRLRHSPVRAAGERSARDHAA